MAVEFIRDWGCATRVGVVWQLKGMGSEITRCLAGKTGKGRAWCSELRSRLEGARIVRDQQGGKVSLEEPVGHKLPVKMSDQCPREWHCLAMSHYVSFTY